MVDATILWRPGDTSRSGPPAERGAFQVEIAEADGLTEILQRVREFAHTYRGVLVELADEHVQSVLILRLPLSRDGAWAYNLIFPHEFLAFLSAPCIDLNVFALACSDSTSDES